MVSSWVGSNNNLSILIKIYHVWYIQDNIIMVQIFIDNEWVNSASGKTFPTVNPATGKAYNIEKM